MKARDGALSHVICWSALVFEGILFVLFTGIGREDLPQELGLGSGMTCGRRVRDWTETGVFDRMHQAMLDHCNAAGPRAWRRRVDRS
ncbi:transposase [Nocardia takedensis]|uniref:transposase n=1 Tax=Nocardia takedensis TaxID=259390 RepID=UPI003F7579BE